MSCSPLSSFSSWSIFLHQSRQRKQMNLARSDRALGSMDETTHKRLKTVDETELEPGAEVDWKLWNILTNTTDNRKNVFIPQV